MSQRPSSPPAPAARTRAVWPVWAGRVILLVACAYLINVVRHQWNTLATGPDLLPHPAALAACVAAYAAAAVLLAAAWHRLLLCYRCAVPWSTAFQIYARTQIAKYLPGNVFHFAGRHASLAARDIAAGAVAGSNLYEIISVLLAAGLLVFVGLLVGRNPWGAPALAAIVLGGAGLVVAPLAINVVARRLRPLNSLCLPADHAADLLRRLLPVLLLHVAFFAGTAATFAAFAGWCRPDVQAQVVLVITAYLAAWVIGFVTPGAPGGAGVREAVLTTLLGGLYGDAGALALALGFRVVTVLGDVAFFLMSFAVKTRSQPPTTPAR